MRPSVREIAAGKWAGILMALGFDSKMLSGKHQPCPNCGGVDRFRWDDKRGMGTFYCSVCGAGDGVELVMRVKEWDFKTAAREIEQAAGFVKPEALKQARSDEDKRRALIRLWKESFPVDRDSPVTRYLERRNLPIPNSSVLRYHPELTYRDGEKSIGKFHAMLALVQAPDGSGATLHRTYLNFDGTKASVPSAKKLCPGLPLSGAAVRLFSVGPCLGIAEGIETALAASNRFSIPVWAAVSANGLDSWVVPPGVSEVVVFGDNDASFTGQKVAASLAHRLAMSGLKVRVEIPQETGKDWADLCA